MLLRKERLIERSVGQYLFGIRVRTHARLRGNLIAFAHDSKRVLVEAEPDVNAVLANTSVFIAPGSAFPSKAPRLFVHGDVVFLVWSVLLRAFLPCARPREFPRSRHSRTSAADDR